MRSDIVEGNGFAFYKAFLTRRGVWNICGQKEIFTGNLNPMTGKEQQGDVARFDLVDERLNGKVQIAVATFEASVTPNPSALSVPAMALASFTAFCSLTTWA